MTRQGTVVLLAGPVGAGKTTVARLLRERWPDGPLAFIEGDRFWEFVARPLGQTRKGDFSVLVRSMTAAAVPFARSGFDVIVDFSIPPGFMRAARRIVRDLPLAYAVLLPSEPVCAARAAGRQELTIGDYEPFRRLYGLFGGVEGWPDYDRHVIRGDALTPDAIVERLLDGIAEGRFAIP